MKLLFITQKLHGQDAFTVLWIEEFVRRGYEVEVLCLEWRPGEAKRMLGREEPQEFPFTVHSLGKEKGAGRAAQVFAFLRLISRLRYDRVFIHMTPVWGLVGAPVWLLRRTPVYLWYTHYRMQAGLRLLGIYGKRLFCATPQSLPHYAGSAKKIVIGHGIDLSFWPRRDNHSADPQRLLAVHRLSRSKRLEISLRALALLPSYTLDIYGMDAEPDYAAEMRALAAELGIADRAVFHGSIPAKKLPGIYAAHRLILNMASETIDKTMLEAMTCGCYPVTTAGNAEAIGLRDAVERYGRQVGSPDAVERYGRQVGIPAAPAADTPEAVADFVRQHAAKPPLSAGEMYRVVEEGHSLQSLVEKMDSYIRPGI